MTSNSGPDDCFNLGQSLTILKAVDNLQTIPATFYDQCEDFLQSTLASYHGKTLPRSPQKLLKTMSSMTSTSSFSLVGSSLLGSQNAELNDDSNVQMDERDTTERGWDWRAGVAKGAKGEDVLRILRLGLAKKVARSWAEGINT